MAVSEQVTEAPGRHQPFAISPSRSLLYRAVRGTYYVLLRLWFRPRISGRELVPTEGPFIIAPVHRSFADFSFALFCTDRKIFFMAKDSLWKSRLLGKFLLTMGAFPVHRESADREALERAEKVLEQGQVLVLFPEGTRREGPVIEDVLEGAAFLAARTGAPIVPLGIAVSDLAMPKGTKVPKRMRIELVARAPLQPPPRSEKGRVPRSAVHSLTEELVGQLQSAYDEAKATSGRY